MGSKSTRGTSLGVRVARTAAPLAAGKPRGRVDLVHAAVDHQHRRGDERQHYEALKPHDLRRVVGRGRASALATQMAATVKEIQDIIAEEAE